MMIASKLKSEKFAQTLLKKYYLDDPSNINFLDLLGSEKLHYQERSIKSSLGSLIRHKQYGQILVNSKIRDKAQKRFIIAHELGHWSMHDNMPIFNCDHSKFKYWDKKIDIIEKEANWFASEFLMPKESFVKYCTDKTLSHAIIRSISNKYKTSLTASTIRFADHGNESIMIVFSRNNQMVWNYGSSDFQYGFFGRNQPIPNNSITSHSFKNSDEYSEISVIKANEWFQNDFSVEEDKYLNEIVFPMPTYNSSLTILWQHELNFESF